MIREELLTVAVGHAGEIEAAAAVGRIEEVEADLDAVLVVGFLIDGEVGVVEDRRGRLIGQILEPPDVVVDGERKAVGRLGDPVDAGLDGRAGLVVRLDGVAVAVKLDGRVIRAVHPDGGKVVDVDVLFGSRLHRDIDGEHLAAAFTGGVGQHLTVDGGNKAQRHGEKPSFLGCEVTHEPSCGSFERKRGPTGQTGRPKKTPVRR